MGFLAAGLGIALLSNVGGFTQRYVARMHRANLVPFAPRLGAEDPEPPGKPLLMRAARALGIAFLGFGMLIGSPTLKSFPYGSVIAITVSAVGLVLWAACLFPYLWTRADNQRARTVVLVYSLVVVGLLAAAVITARF